VSAKSYIESKLLSFGMDKHNIERYFSFAQRTYSAHCKLISTENMSEGQLADSLKDGKSNAHMYIQFLPNRKCNLATSIDMRVWQASDSQTDSGSAAPFIHRGCPEHKKPHAAACYAPGSKSP
jgi:molybdopterin-biosynthesis enzyme MoeA-like protein